MIVYSGNLYYEFFYNSLFSEYPCIDIRYDYLIFNFSKRIFYPVCKQWKGDAIGKRNIT